MLLYYLYLYIFLYEKKSIKHQKIFGKNFFKNGQEFLSKILFCKTKFIACLIGAPRKSLLNCENFSAILSAAASIYFHISSFFI